MVKRFKNSNQRFIIRLFLYKLDNLLATMNQLVKKRVKEAKEKEEDNHMITKPYPAWIDSRAVYARVLSARLKFDGTGRPAPASSAFPGKMWAGSAEWGTVP